MTAQTDVLFPPLPDRIKVGFSKPFWNLPKILLGAWTDDVFAGIYRRLKAFGIKKVVLTDSGTNALYLALNNMGLKKSDEIILPSFICKTVINVVLAVGARPVLADIDDDFNISPESIKAALTKNTKAVIAIHQYGKLCRIDEIKKICAKNKLVLIEDSAVPFGLKYKGKYVGTFGDYGIYSFNMGKTIVSFGGGALILNNQIKERSFKLENPKGAFGRFIFFLTNIYYKKFFVLLYNVLLGLKVAKRYDNICELYERVNQRETVIIPRKMGRLQASAVLHQLVNLPKIIGNQKKIADTYYEELSGIKQVQLPDGKSHLFTYFPVTVDNRYKLASWLSKNGIETQWTFYPLHLQNKFRGFAKVSLKKTDKLWKKELSLPMSARMKEREALYVCEKIKEFYQK